MEENKPMGVYVHIPFCTKKCDYCDFVSFSMDETAQQQYLEALCNEIELYKYKYADRVFDSLYIGGGTPSLVTPEFIKVLTRKLFSSLHFADYTEITLEVNPASFTRQKFLEYVRSGINRISIGVQSVDSALLSKIGRKQNFDDVKNAFQIINQSKFLNTSADVMIGIPGQTRQSVKDTVEFLINNDLKHVSVYTLQVEKHTPLYDKFRAKRIKPMSDKRIVSYYDQAAKMLMDAGYVRYELSNFARPGFESAHNIKYWDESEYLGLGIAAHSYIDGYRYSNTRRMDRYIDLCSKMQSPIEQREYISDKTRRTERIMLSLRTQDGLDLQKFKRDFNEDLMVTKAKEIETMMKNNLLAVDNGFLYITPNSFSVSNAIITELI